jgi:hypothetical protein
MEYQNISVMGFYEIQHFRQGKLINTINFKNIITNTGLAEIAALIGLDTTSVATAFDYVAWGTNATAAAATQTALLGEIITAGGERGAGAGSRITTTTTNDTFQLQKTFTFTGSLSLREIGVFNDSSVGVMLSRQTLVIDVINGDAITVTYKIIFSRP